VPVMRYVNPRKAEWPEAEFIVGNPPFLGNKRMRPVFGDAYVDMLRSLYTDVPSTVDYVMYWWSGAAATKCLRFGFITTNSITQPLNRVVLQRALGAGSDLTLVFAVPDHPWVDSVDGAAVRIAMTVASRSGSRGGVLGKTEAGNDAQNLVTLSRRTVEHIHPDLSGDIDVSRLLPLRANEGLANVGVYPYGEGFRLRAYPQTPSTLS
jgi:hypothetical protein